MSTLTIYHNPRCTKSRMGLSYLRDLGLEPVVREYLSDPLTEAELSDLLKQLSITAEQLLRKGEAIYKELFKGKDLSQKEWIRAMVEHPKLMERPIVSNGKTAVIGRPTERIAEVLDRR